MLATATLRRLCKDLSHNGRPAGKLVLAAARLGKSIYIGSNAYKTHPDMYTVKSSGIEVSYAHAELVAIAKVPRQSRHLVEVFVWRVTRDGTLTMARPCTRCRTYLLKEGIDPRNIYHTNWQGAWVPFCIN